MRAATSTGEGRVFCHDAMGRLVELTFAPDPPYWAWADYDRRRAGGEPSSRAEANPAQEAWARREDALEAKPLLGFPGHRGGYWE